MRYDNQISYIHSLHLPYAMHAADAKCIICKCIYAFAATFHQAFKIKVQVTLVKPSSIISIISEQAVSTDTGPENHRLEDQRYCER